MSGHGGRCLFSVCICIVRVYLGYYFVWQSKFAITAATLQLRVFVGAHLFQVHVHLCESPAQLIAVISCRFGAHPCCLLCLLAYAGPCYRKAVTEVFVVCGQVHEQSTEPLAQLLCSVSERGGGRLWFLQL